MTTQTTNTALEDIEKNKEKLKCLSTQYDPSLIEEKAAKELITQGEEGVKPESALFKAITLNEFNNGYLMCSAIPEQYRTFAIDFCRKLQKEYECKSVSEKATCELAVINFIRTLEIQNRMNLRFSNGISYDIELRYLAILSKELDRANRHYLTAIQTLRMMKQAPPVVNIKAQTAIVGQNQVVQANNGHE